MLHHIGLPLEQSVIMDSMKVEVLGQWIADQQPSWEVLVSSVEKCGGVDIADNMRRELNITAPHGTLEEHGKAYTCTCLIVQG